MSEGDTPGALTKVEDNGDNQVRQPSPSPPKKSGEKRTINDVSNRDDEADGDTSGKKRRPSPSRTSSSPGSTASRSSVPPPSTRSRQDFRDGNRSRGVPRTGHSRPPNGDRRRGPPPQSLEVRPKGGPTPPVRFFILKSNDKDDVLISQRQNIWATQHFNEDKLNEAFEDGQVVLIFSINNSRAFQGYATMEGRIDRDTPTQWLKLDGRSSWGGVFKVQWQAIYDVPFEITQHLTNPYNDNYSIKRSRDGQEITEELGLTLLKMFDAGVAKQPKHLQKVQKTMVLATKTKKELAAGGHLPSVVVGGDEETTAGSTADAEPGSAASGSVASGLTAGEGAPNDDAAEPEEGAVDDESEGGDADPVVAAAGGPEKRRRRVRGGRMRRERAMASRDQRDRSPRGYGRDHRDSYYRSSRDLPPRDFRDVAAYYGERRPDVSIKAFEEFMRSASLGLIPGYDLRNVGAPYGSYPPSYPPSSAGYGGYSSSRASSGFRESSSRDSRDSRDTRDSRDSRDTRDSRDSRDTRDSRDSRDSRRR